MTVTAASSTRGRAASGATVRGQRGVVGCTAPLAAAAGAAIAAEGGNAFDAALAAALAETVLLPPKCGLAGDVVALVVAPGAAPRALVAIGPAPRRLAEHVTAYGLPLTGGASVGVPGAPAGYAALAALARRPLADLVAPAAALARDGFAWSPIDARLAAEADDLLRTWQPDGCCFRPARGPIAVGETVRTPAVADLLEAFAELGAGLWTHERADALVAAVHRAGGVVEADDLTSARAQWSDAAAVDVAGATVWATPLPTHGPSLLGALADALGGPAAGPRTDTLADAVAGAVERRRREHGDPDVGRTADGTSVVAAVDADGTAVVVVHSNSFPRFGAGIVVDALGVVLNNRAGRGFTATPGHPNFPAPGRRPMTTLHAWALGAGLGTGAAGVHRAGGTPGGEQQVGWNAQVLTAALAGERDPGALVDLPLWELHGGGRLVERDASGAAPAGLGAGDELVDAFSSRSAQVVVGWDADRPIGAADRRLGAVAVPW